MIMKMSKLLKKHTTEELADAFVFRSNLTQDEEAISINELRDARAACKAKQVPEQKIYMNLLQIKFQMQDYIKGEYNESYSFGYFLKKYVEVVNKLNKDFADDIDIKQTELSQLINNHRAPAEKIIIRLELHSGNIIPALLWMKVLDKQREHAIVTNKTIRLEESNHVKNRFALS